jgi:DNA sulfur modification protein DndB
MIHLACTHGNLGYWEYYSTIMKVEDIVSNNRVITVAESDELYTRNINKVLQREIDKKRIKALTSYIKNNNERFFSSIVVAIHKGQPQWTEIDLKRNFEIDGISIDDISMNFLQSKFGVLTLIGNEEIFALDGQHRLMGLRKAYQEDPDNIGGLELSILFVVHKQEEYRRTRRLFTVLNKFAEKPKGAELIILDEDDARAIITRKLISNHEHLSKPNGISDSRSAGIPTNDLNSFTTLVTINQVNNILFKRAQTFYSTRPSIEVLESLYELSKSFWDAIFEAFPSLVEFIDGDQTIKIGDKSIIRNSNFGGSLLLRPIGHTLLANAYKYFLPDERELFINKIRLIDFNLSSQNWKYLIWNERILPGNLVLRKTILLYLLGKFDNEEYISEQMEILYETFNQEYQNNIVPVEIP